MKNYFLFALLLVFSLYSVAALYQGTIPGGFNVDENPEITVGDQPSFEVGSGGSGSGGSSGGGGVIFSSESDTNENTARFFQENISIVNGTRNDTNILFNEASPGITGAVIGALGTGGTIMVVTFILVLVFLVVLVTISARKERLIKVSNNK